MSSMPFRSILEPPHGDEKYALRLANMHEGYALRYTMRHTALRVRDSLAGATDP